MIPPNTPKRPNRKDETVIKFAANALACDVQQWLKEDGTIEEIESNLIDALSSAFSRDGYCIARQLEHMGYDPDAELVEILDRAGSYFDEAWRTACALWVKDHNITAPQIGTKVRRVDLIVHPNLMSDPGIGIITSNHPEGRSSVSFPDLGHIGHIENRDRKTCGTLGFVVEWENLELVATPEQCCDEPRGLVGGPCDHCGNTVQPEPS